MNDLPYANTLTQIHQLLVANFDKEELKPLCLGLTQTCDDLPTTRCINKARELVTYLAGRGRLPDLRKAVSPTPLPDQTAGSFLPMTAAT